MQGNEYDNYMRHLFDNKNPVFISILFTIFLLATIFIFFKFVIFPLIKKHNRETNKLKLKNARLLALFTKIDPDPVIRIDFEGKILQFNKSALRLSPDNQLENKHIKYILPGFEFNFNAADGHPGMMKTRYNFKINGRYYIVVCKIVKGYGFAQLYFNDVTELKVYQQKLQNANEQLQKFSQRLHKDIEEERTRIARELHDEIGQNLLIMQAVASSVLENGGTDDGIIDKVSRIKDLQGKTYLDIKRILNNLKPAILEEMGIGPALNSLVEKIIKESKIKGSFDYMGEEERFNPALEVALYRICQEGINNIMKHSNAEEFNIQFINRKNSVKVVISDNGKGIKNNGNLNEGMGMMNMRKRAEFLNGTFKMNSEPGNGTVLFIEIPKAGLL